MNFRKTISSALRRLFANHVYVSRHGLAKGLRRKGGWAFLPSFVPRSMEMQKEEELFESLDLAGRTVFDIGGDQGVYTLFFARAVGPGGRVITFEPNPASHRGIVTNVELNGFTHVNVRNIGAGDRRTKLKFVYPASAPGRGSFDPALQSEIGREDDARTLEIAVNTVDGEIAGAGLPAPDFVKIDVEGLERSVLAGMTATMRTAKPRIFIEMHGADDEAKRANARAVVGCLIEHGYEVRHVESGAVLTRESAETARSGHVYAVPGASPGKSG
jgi:FkbM family methyltransferase